MKRHNMLRRLLSVVLCFVMVFSLFPVSVFAEGAQEEPVQAQEPVEPAEAPEQPGDEIKETVKLRVDYVSEDGAALAEAYELSVEKGAALEVAVPFAAVEGFRPARVIFAALPENGDLALLVPEGTEPALTLGAEGESPIAVYGECANVQVTQEGLTLTGAAEADVSVVVTYAALEPSQTDTPAEPEQPADSSQQPAKAPANDLLSALTGKQTLGLGVETYANPGVYEERSEYVGLTVGAMGGGCWKNYMFDGKFDDITLYYFRFAAGIPGAPTNWYNCKFNITLPSGAEGTCTSKMLYTACVVDFKSYNYWFHVTGVKTSWPDVKHVDFGRTDRNSLHVQSRWVTGKEWVNIEAHYRDMYNDSNYCTVRQNEGVSESTAIRTVNIRVDGKVVKTLKDQLFPNINGMNTDDIVVSNVNGKYIDKGVTIENGQYYVNLETKAYNVTYSITGTTPSGVTGMPANETNIKAGASKTVGSKPSAPGYTFSGWTTNDVTVSGGKFTMPGKDVTFTGSFTPKSYNITYKITGSVNANDNYKTEKLAYGTSVTAAAEPDAPAGYKFSGWSSIPATMPANDITVTGSFVKDESQKENKTYTVTYYQGGTSVKSETVTESVWAGATTIPVNAAKINTTDYFGTDYKCTNTEPSPLPGTIVVGGEIKVFYSRLYPLVYQYITTDMGAPFDDLVDPPPSAAAKLPETTMHVSLEEVTVAPFPVVPGYEFHGWMINDNTVAPGETFAMDAGQVTLMGYFSAIDYTVTYKAAEGSPAGYTLPADLTGQHAETEITAGTVSAPKGYKFTGWTSDEVILNAEGKFTMPAENVTLTAHFEKDDSQKENKSFYVDYYRDGERINRKTITRENVYVLEDTLTIEAGDVNTTDYFGSDYTVDHTVPAVVPGTIAVDGVIEVYYVRNAYTVTYTFAEGAPEGAALPDPSQLTGKHMDDSIPAPNATVPTGYTLTWTSEDVILNADGSFTMPAGNVTLTGRFTANTNTGYKVVHVKQNLDGNYPEYDLTKDLPAGVEVEDKTGTTGAQTEAKAKDYTGFTAGTVTQAAIAGDDSTVVEIRYARLNNLSYTVKYLDEAGNAIAEAKTVENQIFETVIKSKNEIIEIEGYTFDHSNPTSIEIGAVNENNVIDLYYTKDEKGITIIDDEEKQGDGIPDKFQITVNFASDENGTVTGTASELITIMNFDRDSETNAIVADSVVLKAEVERMPAAAVVDDPADGYQAGVWYNGETAVEGSLETIRGTALTADTTYTVKHEKRNDLKYTVNYLDEAGNAIAEVKTVENQIFETVINSEDEIISIPYYVFDHADTASLTIGTGENVINLYYTEDKDNNGYPDEYEITVSFAAGTNGTVTGAVSETITTQTFSRDADGNIIAGSVTDVEAHADADVTAAPNAGFRFVNWTAGEASYADLAAIRALDLREDTTFTANFAPRTDLAYTVNYLEAGTGTALAAPATVTGQTFGSTVTVNPVAIAGYTTPAAQTLTIAVTGNVVNFYYAAIPVIPGNPVVDIPPIPPLPENIDDEITPLDGPEVTVDDPVNIDDEATPLAEGAHNSCILHFLILCAALLIELLYVSSMKQRQQKVFEIRRELKK